MAPQLFVTSLVQAPKTLEPTFFSYDLLPVYDLGPHSGQGLTQITLTTLSGLFSPQKTL